MALLENDQTLQDVNAITSSVEGSMQNLSSCISSSQSIVNTICSTVLSWKQIDYEMCRFDAQIKTISKQMDINLEMYKTRAPIIREQLNSISRLMEKVLEKVLEMDTNTEIEMKMKLRYVDMVDNYMNSLSTMVTKLL